MKNVNDVCVLVQARLGSERVPRKMMRPFAGTTLMDICLKKLSESKVIPKDNIFASVHEPELVSVTKKHGINLFQRSKESADSEGTPMSLMYEWWDKLPYKYCVLVSACAPFLSLETIENFYEEYLRINNNGLFGVVEKKNYFWNNKGHLTTPWPEGQAVMNTKYVESTFEAAHCLYAGSMNMIGSGIWMGDFSKPGDIKLYNMEEKEVFDIDYEWQFLYYEKLYKLGVR